MYYTLSITVEIRDDIPAVQYRPITIETISTSKQDVTEQELNMVANAFRDQIKGLLRRATNND